MASVLHSLTTSRSSPPIAASASPISSTHRRPALGLPAVRGLRVSFTSPPIRSCGSLTHKTSRSTAATAGRIVSEAQDTAVEVLPVTDKTWDSLVLESESTVLVEFWAPWCGPCRMIHPVIDSLAGEYVGKLKCYKLNTDESPSIATRYGIRSIPTIMIFKGGEKKDAIIGAVPKTTITSSVEKFL